MAALAQAMLGGVGGVLSVAFCVYFGQSEAIMDGGGAYRLFQHIRRGQENSNIINKCINMSLSDLCQI